MAARFDGSQRIAFHEALGIMEVDFSDLTFNTSAEVNKVYDQIEHLIDNTGRKWYFMVNYRDTRIQPEAWFQHALRGKDVNVASSLGTVRFDARERTREEILERAREDGFNPNIVSTRDEALARIAELRLHGASAPA